MQLRHDNALGTVDNKGALGGHVRNHAKIDMLLYRLEVLVVRIFATQFHFGLQRNAVSKATLDTLLDGITGRINVIIKEFELEIISCVSDGEILFENFKQPLVKTVVGIGLNLEEVFERLHLNIEEIRVIKFAN